MKSQDQTSQAIRDAYEIIEPYAPAIIESLRAVGYDLPMAIADLADNSLTAEASKIDIDFFWDGENSSIAVLDNGCGMNDERLAAAMRVGSADPTLPRDRKDLGRFGLGLKTASFSECRRVTVITRSKGNELCTRCWDLDYVRQTEEWRVLRNGSPRSSEYSGRICETGTCVIWEKLDRLVAGTTVENAKDLDSFHHQLKAVEKHLAMVFHRFMEGPRPVIFRINGSIIKPWDPFLSHHPATQHPEALSLTLRGETITADAYVLPHHSRLTPEEYAQAAGPYGWVAHQGFYVYRNARLLVPGDWLETGVKKEEHLKLARMRLDLPNTLDDLWGLDIKKNTARVPPVLRPSLHRFAQATRTRAVDVYRHRGAIVRRTYGDKTAYVWDQKVSHGKVFYRINRNHPLVKSILRESESRKSLNTLLRLIEESVPVPRIILNNREDPESQALPYEGAQSPELIDLAVQFYVALKHSGCSHADALRRLHVMEPFDRLSEFAENITETLKQKKIL